MHYITKPQLQHYRKRLWRCPNSHTLRRIITNTQHATTAIDYAPIMARASRYIVHTPHFVTYMTYLQSPSTIPLGACVYVQHTDTLQKWNCCFEDLYMSCTSAPLSILPSHLLHNYNLSLSCGHSTPQNSCHDKNVVYKSRIYTWPPMTKVFVNIIFAVYRSTQS